MTDPELLDVPVEGGSLRVARYGPRSGAGPPVAVAIHGITSSHRFWSLVGEAVDDDLTVLAPDLRGRGDSGDLPGPYGMAAHVRDVVAVLDHAGVDQALLVGHSMGGFVAACAAAAHPDRVRGVVLVDGGPPLTAVLPADADLDEVLHAIIGPSLERLSQRFSSREEYREFWRRHPAFADVPRAHADAYADHDLTGEEPRLRSKVSADAVREDARDTLVNEAVRTAVERLRCPAVLLWAERGVLDQPAGLYDAATVAGYTDRLPNLEAACVPGTNHFTIGLSPHGAATVARHLASPRLWGAAGS